MNTFQRNLFITVNSIVPGLAISVIACMLLHYYPDALACTIAIVLLMETRVQMAGRLKKGPLFYLHVSASFLFLITLIALCLAHTTLAATLSAWIAATVMFSTGVVLWYRGLRTFLDSLSHQTL